VPQLLSDQPPSTCLLSLESQFTLSAKKMISPRIEILLPLKESRKSMIWVCSQSLVFPPYGLISGSSSSLQIMPLNHGKLG